MMVSPGINVPSISRPSGGVILCTPDGTGECSLSASSMHACRYGNFESAECSGSEFSAKYSSISSLRRL